jgi:hypothetical protein
MRISPFSKYKGAFGSDPEPAFRVLVKTLNQSRLGWLELADTSFWYGKFERSRLLYMVKPLFDGKIIANGGIEPHRRTSWSQKAKWMRRPSAASGWRIRAAGTHPHPRALRQAEPKTLLRRRPDGYNDYPTLAEDRARQGP